MRSLGGLVGSFVAGWGFAAVHWRKVLSIVVVMVASPLIGFAITFIAARFALSAGRRFTPKAGRVFDRLQLVTLLTQALSHGTNDAQKTMGVITFVLVVLGLQEASTSGPLVIHRWVIVACSSVMAAGTMIGGWRIIKTLGTGLYRVNTYMHLFRTPPPR